MTEPKPGDVLINGESRIVVLHVTEYWQASLTSDPDDGYYETVVWVAGEPTAFGRDTHVFTAEPQWRIHWRPDGAERTLTSTSPSTYPPLGWTLKRP